MAEIPGHTYGSIRSTIWRMSQKHPGREYSCKNFAGTIMVVRDK